MLKVFFPQGSRRKKKHFLVDNPIPPYPLTPLNGLSTKKTRTFSCGFPYLEIICFQIISRHVMLNFDTHTHLTEFLENIFIIVVHKLTNFYSSLWFNYDRSTAYVHSLRSKYRGTVNEVLLYVLLSSLFNTD